MNIQRLRLSIQLSQSPYSRAIRVGPEDALWVVGIRGYVTDTLHRNFLSKKGIDHNPKYEFPIPTTWRPITSIPVW